MKLVDKYKPKQWSDVVGQDGAVLVLTKILDNYNTTKNMPPPLLLAGPDGTGRKSCLSLFQSGIDLADWIHYSYHVVPPDFIVPATINFDGLVIRFNPISPDLIYNKLEEIWMSETGGDVIDRVSAFDYLAKSSHGSLGTAITRLEQVMAIEKMPNAELVASLWPDELPGFAEKFFKTAELGDSETGRSVCLDAFYKSNSVSKLWDSLTDYLSLKATTVETKDGAQLLGKLILGLWNNGPMALKTEDVWPLIGYWFYASDLFGGLKSSSPGSKKNNLIVTPEEAAKVLSQ